MEQVQNPVCLHFHIFKNGGSTLEWIFNKNFPKHVLSIDGKSPEDILSIDKILEYLKKHPKTKAISSHQIRFPVPKDSKFHLIPILFIRHPIDRAFSIYSFKKKENDNSIGTIKARNLNLKDFIKWNLELRGYMVMKNFQTLFLVGKGVRGLPTQEDFQVACDQINSCDVIGVVDRMDESLVVAEEILKNYFRDIDLSYVPQNVSKDRKGDMMNRIESGKQQIGEEIMNSLIEQNQFDMMLYENSNKSLDKRISKIQDFDKKLDEFRNRCRQIQIQ